MGSPQHVLYADTDRHEAGLARTCFERLAPDLKLEIATSGEEFLRLARTGRYAAFLINRQLPDADGLELLKTLVQENIPQPVILLSRSADPEEALAALRLGAVDYVSKRQSYLERLPERTIDALARSRSRQGTALHPRPRRILWVDNKPDKHSDRWLDELAVTAPLLSFVSVASLRLAQEELEQDTTYDLVLASHRPPRIDGLALLRQLRDSHFRTPIILVAESPGVEDIAAAIRLGAVDFIHEPGRNPAEFALRISLAIEQHELALAHTRAAAELCERRQTVAALRESEKRLNLAINAGRIGLLTWRVDTGETQFSARWKAQIGYEEDEIRNDPSEWETRCHPDDVQHVHAMVARFLESPWPDFTLEYRLRHKDGTWRWFMLHADLELDEGRKPVRMLGSQIDITALKRHQADLSSASARLQQLSRRLLHVQELERRHLARELHDEIGQVLTVAKMHLQSAVMDSAPSPLAERIREPVALLDRLLAQVRSLSLNLRPPLLDDLGLLPSLHWLIQQHEARASTPRLHLNADPLIGRCDPMLETACFRIAQEALTNAIRHAQATNVHISVSTKDGALCLRVRDDGVGFDAAAARSRSERGGSLGLLSLHERALLAGGSLTLLSAPGHGTEVEAIFPLCKQGEDR